MTPGCGQPKVNETTGTGSAASSASLLSQSSSSKRAWPRSAPARCASAASLAAYAATSSGSAGVPGTNTLTPNGPLVSVLTCAICSWSAAAAR